MSLSKQYKTNETKVSQGFAHHVGENADGSQIVFHLSRMAESNQRYAATMARATAPHKRKIALGTLPESEAKRITRDVFITSVLMGWEHVLLSDVTGDLNDTGFAPFNKTNAERLFERLPDLYQELVGEAANLANFLQAELEEEVKN